VRNQNSRELPEQVQAEDLTNTDLEQGKPRCI
jgi:hypothetical protein